jgi:lactoylglutathione lyase
MPPDDFGSTTSGTTPAIEQGALLRADHVTLLVSSLETSMPYYDALLRVLGWTKQRDHVWTDGAGMQFQFLEAHAGTRAYKRYGAGMNRLGFAAPDAAFVAHVREAMAAAGNDVPEIQHLGGATALFMRDLDGIRLEVTYDPPGMQRVD